MLNKQWMEPGEPPPECSKKRQQASVALRQACTGLCEERLETRAARDKGAGDVGVGGVREVCRVQIVTHHSRAL